MRKLQADQRPEECISRVEAIKDGMRRVTGPAEGFTLRMARQWGIGQYVSHTGEIFAGQDVRLGSRQDDDAPSAVERSAFILNAMCRGHSVHRPEPLRQLLTRGHDIDPECRKRLHDIRWRAS